MRVTCMKTIMNFLWLALKKLKKKKKKRVK